ncbi:iron ABC transporter substrate-binding protein [Desulfuromonas versatilis]|uniref:Iron ABC transporter substrate-binding protein n=1 Tax=Desulfuromonas versatilis TaxID=2802975 RepID=A0ABN6DUR0_9BACT|nr:iron ABC transporter permease [Desulfuromonas versatilis]BCR03856.1 iron ABC transporter substrate-binding protein [Desulfuromonas versatilis]
MSDPLIDRNTAPERAPQAGAFSAFLRRDFYSGWRLVILLVAVLVIAPMSVVFFSWLDPATEIWKHLAETLLAELLVNTFWLVIGVTTGTVLLGVSLAWLTAVCDFPGRKVFSWALLLPLAVPTYVLAFVSLGLFDFAGPVQTRLRAWFGSSAWFPDMRSTAGVVAVMTLALYPYVYLLTRNAFLTQGKRMLEAAESLGCSPWRAFFKVVLPMARPWIAGGALLVIMEALADFGAVSIFNYDTFTTAIYKAWFGFFSLPAAAQLSSLLVLIVFAIIAFEQWLRSRMRFTAARLSPTGERVQLGRTARWLACAYALAVLSVAFIVPLLQLLVWTLKVFHREFDSRYLQLLTHSLTLGLSAALLVSITALVLAYANRRHGDRLTRGLVRTANLGYALPGTVLAVGIFIPVAALDNTLISLAHKLFGLEIGMLLQGTIFIMLLAYLVRFMAAGFKPIDGAMHRVTPSIDEAARLLGLRGLKLLARIHLPMLRGGVLTAATLVFVDVMKEMPITLMTRPFGWDTFAVKIFELTSEGEWERAALPALTLLLSGLVPIILLMRHTEK